ncbi:hypothetical protein CU098_002901, partial [Rhizopus stolonifer]
MTVQYSSEIMLFNMPKKLPPGGKEMSSIVLSNQKVIDIIVNFLTKAEPDTYRLGHIQSNNKRESVVYLPRSSVSETHPPIVVLVQDNVNRKYMSELIDQSIDASEKYDVLPHVLLICTDSVDEKILGNSEPVKEHESLHQAVCTFWAKSCYIVTKGYAHKQERDVLDPLEAIHYVLSSKVPNLLNLKHRSDPTVISLYEAAMEETKQFVDTNRTLLEDVVTICSFSEKKFEKIYDLLKDKFPPDNEVLTLAREGADHLSKLKSEYQETLSTDSTNESIAPMYEPPNASKIDNNDLSVSPDVLATLIHDASRKNDKRPIHFRKVNTDFPPKTLQDPKTTSPIVKEEPSSSVDFNPRPIINRTKGSRWTDEEFEFADSVRLKFYGRMDWNLCLKDGHTKDYFLNLGTGASLKTTFYKQRKIRLSDYRLIALI